MLRYALEAIAEDEDAAAAAGIHVTAEKLKITVLSAVMTALAGALYCQYQMFISPDTVSGIAISLQMVFAAVVGGIYVPLGPTVGAVFTILLAEVPAHLRSAPRAVGWDNLVYGVLLVLFIIFLPKGILGSAARPSPESAMDLELSGKVAVVTGTSVGLGREIARVLAAEGVPTLVVARRGRSPEDAPGRDRARGRVRPHALPLDLADRAAPARVRDEALARSGVSTS